MAKAAASACARRTFPSPLPGTSATPPAPSGPSPRPSGSGRKRQRFVAFKVPVRPAELVLDHRAALEIVADAQLHRDPDPAVGLDRVLPDRLDAARELEVAAADGSRQQPIMIHRAIFGSLERFFGILIENYAGDFPLWLAPVQIRLLPVSDGQREYAESVAATLKKAGYRVEIDQSGERLSRQIRNAELEKIPVSAILGKREVENQSLSVRIRKAGELGTLSLSELQEHLQAAIEQKTSI